LKQNLNFELIENPDRDNPNNLDAFRHNYKKILQVYIILIESGKWDEALEKFFYDDVHWKTGQQTTKETENAYKTLTEYIKRFD